MNRRLLISITTATLLALGELPAGGHAATRAAAATPSRATGLSVIARHLDQPKKLTLASSGNLIVALSGDGRSPASCADSDELTCEDHSGAVDEVTPSGTVSTLVSDLTSISSGHDDPQATGPVEARLVGGRLQVLFQDLDLNSRTGISTFGARSLLGDLVSFSTGSVPSADAKASLGVYEAEHEPDKDVLGSAVAYGYEAAINSDPYSFVAYRGGWAVADAGANDVLWISHSGAIRVLAVLPTIREYAKADTFGSTQTRAIEAAVQAVPTAVAVGPDGDLYVGELGGSPFTVGTEDVYRIVPGHAATVWATGFTTIGDVSFDSHGRLDVLELDKKGLADPGLDDNAPASGVLIRVANAGTATDPRAGTRSVLIDSGLSMPTGLAVASDGDIYLTNDGTTTDGEILRLRAS
jgi:hypothetical protein